MAKWTEDAVAERFEEAAITARRLPPVKVQGYVSSWPAIKREVWEQLGAEIEPIRLPPGIDAEERMLETMRWVLWLSEEQRHLIWLRAWGVGWKSICRRFGCDRTTGWRRWQRALGEVVSHLNNDALDRYLSR